MFHCVLCRCEAAEWINYMKAVKTIVISLLVLVVLAAGAWYLMSDVLVEVPDCWDAVENYAKDMLSKAYSIEPETENAHKLWEILNNSKDAVPERTVQQKKSAQGSVTYIDFDIDAAAEELISSMTEALAERVEHARVPSEIYDENDSYKAEMIDEIFNECLNALEREKYLHVGTAYLELSYSKDNGWMILNPDAMGELFTADCETIYAKMMEKVIAAVPRAEFHFAVPYGSLAGPEPAQENFGSTTDPTVITGLLNDSRARKLIGDDKMAWREDIEFLPDSVINYYLDDTILMLQWQENTDGCCGTYSEVFIADASQLRRKFAGDAFGSMEFNYATAFAQQTNSVIAFGGDLYNHGRACGIVVYGGEIYRFEPNTCDTLYFDRDGNMLYSLRWEFSEEAQAQALIEENGVDFSLCFGPMLIADGKDITPDTYNWGEINDTYARSAIGQLGELHYFVGNLNCFYNTPHILATLHQMTDAMAAHGCYMAYALDGGQTAETVVNGVMMNPVQFGAERVVSDIIYFCTAIPD